MGHPSNLQVRSISGVHQNGPPHTELKLEKTSDSNSAFMTRLLLELTPQAALDNQTISQNAVWTETHAQTHTRTRTYTYIHTYVHITKAHTQIHVRTPSLWEAWFFFGCSFWINYLFFKQQRWLYIGYMTELWLIKLLIAKSPRIYTKLRFETSKLYQFNQPSYQQSLCFEVDNTSNIDENWTPFFNSQRK